MSSVLQLAGGAMQYSAYQQQAAATKSIASYNANLNINQAKQGELDLAANISRQRDENRQLMAGQRASYAAAGLLQEGSPLQVEAETAGRLQTNIQMAHMQQQQKTRQLYDAAAMGVWEGNQQAKGLKLQSYAALINGAAGATSQVVQAGGFI
jgi:hypothetical protein